VQRDDAPAYRRRERDRAERFHEAFAADRQRTIDRFERRSIDQGDRTRGRFGFDDLTIFTEILKTEISTCKNGDRRGDPEKLSQERAYDLEGFAHDRPSLLMTHRSFTNDRQVSKLPALVIVTRQRSNRMT